MIDDSSCTYANCAEDYGYAIYKNGAMVGSTTDNFHTFLGLINGAEYDLELLLFMSLVLQKYLP